MNFFLCVTIILLQFICVVKCCNTFESVYIQLFPKSLPQYNDTIEGCIDPTTIDNPQRTIRSRKVIVQYENIPTLKHGTVQNLARLEEVKIFDCSVKSVKVGAFRHLPSLKTIDLESNKIKTVHKIFQDLPSLRKIILDNNNIYLIENEAFANLDNLNEIYLRFNKIKVWNEKWFYNVGNVKSVYFDYNAIERLSEDAFVNLQSIEKIHLSYNNMSTIEKDALNSIIRLNYLDLSYNYIKSVDKYCLTNQLTIAELHLNANKLNFLPSTFLDNLQVENFAYDGNPWLCSCYHELSSWLIRTNVTAKNSFYCNNSLLPVCANPVVPSDTCLETYDEESTEFYFSAVKDTNNNFLKRCVRAD